jgi:hypothetical protein
MKKIITIIISIISIATAKAQAATEEQLKQSINHAEIIVEGKIIASESFSQNESSKIYTSYTIEISKIIKGNYANRTIEIVKRGGILNDRFEISDHSIALSKGTEGLFFLNPLNNNLNNSFSIYDFTEYFSDGINPPAVGQGKAYKNVEVELLQKIQEFTKNQVLSIKPNSKEIKNGFAIPHIITDPNFLPQVRGVKNNSRSSTGIEYTLDNIQVTGTSPKFLEFDVMVKATSSGTKIANINVALAYNSQAFGFSMVANNKITTTIGSTFNNAPYTNIFYLQDRPSPPSPNPIDTVIIGSLSQPTDVASLVNLPTSATQYVHVKMEIATCNQPSQIYFDLTRMEVLSDFYTGTGPTGYELYSPVIASDSINILLCPTTPVIYDFNPKQITAGTGSVLTITGDNFGTTKGEVYFTNADLDGVNQYMHTFPKDIISWANTEIKVAVPSVEFSGKTAGTGDFYVKLPTGGIANSNQNLDVYYAILNARYPNDSTAIRVNLTNNGNGTTGYKFYTDSIIHNTPKGDDCIRVALKKWNCATGVTWELTGTQNIITNENITDNLNYLYMADEVEFNNPNTTAQTYHKGRVLGCGSVPPPKYYSNELDIAFRKSVSWIFDTTNAPITTNKMDFHSVALHELGHGHSLQHALFLPKVMYPNLNPNQKRAFLSSSEVDGGLDVMQFSSSVLTPPCANPNVQILPAHCDFQINAIRSVSNDQLLNVSVFPNPFNNDLNVKFSSQKESDIMITITDLLGREVFTKLELNVSAGEHQYNIHPEVNTNFSNGFYVLKVQANQGTFTTKLLKSAE